MVRVKYFLIVIIALLHMGRIHAACKTDSIVTDTVPFKLDEVKVVAKSVKRDGCHINIIPSQEQKQHSVNGYVLLYNLMIPGLSIQDDGSVNTMGLSTSLYVNGQKEDVQDVQNLRPADVIKVEFYDMPEGKYARDITAVNFVIRRYDYGGYTQLIAEQMLGYNHVSYTDIGRHLKTI